MMSATVLGRVEADGERPAITYRQAGDRAVLVEYGESDVDLRVNFFVLGVLGALLAEPPDGLVEAAPGFRSIVVGFDPARTTRRALLDALDDVHARQPAVSSLVLPGRRITLPIAFDDSASREAVARYTATIRRDAPNTRGGSNIDYIVERSGLSDPEELFAAVTATSWWTAFIGFFPGLPFLFPLRARQRLFAPKYNPTRAWTAEGAVGIGGRCVAIFPVESPGSFQLFGRTVPVYDPHGRHDIFRDDPFLVRPGDQVRFTRVSEEELLAARRDVFDNRYEYQVDDVAFSVADHLAADAGSP